MINNINKEKIYIGKAKGPINIALIKYWGKEDEELITPLNNSISLTLDTNTFYTETKVTIKQTCEVKDNTKENDISLIINGKPSNITKRIKNIFKKFLSMDNQICKELSISKLDIKIESINTFPIASGCASSASSMAALVLAITSALKLENIISKTELTKIARLGSGSACRSIFGGICEWEKGNKDDSMAVQLYEKNYWDLGIKLIIVSQKEKDVSSSLGMKITKETSELFKYRINYIVKQNLENIKKCLKEKDFNNFAEIIIKDSNNFHACCRDSYPSINYLNEESDFIMKIVMSLNKIYGKNICAYTFDAGSNAFLIYEMKNKTIIDDFFNFILGFSNINISDLIKNIKIENSESNINEINKLIEKRPPKEKILKQIDFILGEGTQILYE
jgi:diphosphomevalonate decarboxylase